MSKKNKLSRKEALAMVVGLVDKANKVFKKDKEQANKVVRKARRIAMKNRIKLPSGVRRKICKHCHSLLIPGINCKVRSKEGNIVYTCFECKKYTKFRYK